MGLKITIERSWASLVAQMVKYLPAMWETRVWFLGREDPLEKEMAIHSITLAWKIPWTEEPDRLQSMGSQRVGHNWETSLSLFTFMHWNRKWQPTPVSLPGESQGWGSLVGCHMGSHRVGHNWSNLAAAAVANYGGDNEDNGDLPLKMGLAGKALLVAALVNFSVSFA